MRISSTRLTALKRPLKKIQNLFKDPLPRNRELVFEGYELNLPEIVYQFSVAGKKYFSTASIDLSAEDLAQLNQEDHHSLFVNLGLALVSGHFLLSDFSTVRVDCAKLDSRQIQLLEKHLLESLTEFRYLLGLDPSRKVRVLSSGSCTLKPIAFNSVEEKALMLNGGGKDSCVSAELLKSIKVPFAWLNAFPNATRFRVIEASGVSENYGVSFFLDKNIKQDAAYPWGVQPYVYAICAASLIVAYVKGFKYIVSGAENSADDPNLVFKGVEVNHQAGKTYSFDQFFNEFSKSAVLEKAELFSIARPYTDLRLGEMFSNFPQYFNAFFSCNVGMGTDKWCNSCHKCAFTYLAFYPFFKSGQLKEIFGAELFELPIIRKYMLELASASIKPWECVGTLEESQLALSYSLKKSPEMDFSEWPRRKDLERVCNNIDDMALYELTMSTFLNPHNVPQQYVEELNCYTDKLLNSSLKMWPEFLPAKG
jgi:UDP-N-acetyl-alpha-D-muramoyl-L-alanyl-L-glutamate epimerase